MTYRLAQNIGDSTAVPQLVFAKLSVAEDEWVRVALYSIATGDFDCASIARSLRLKNKDKASEALLFWKGAGLFESCDTTQTDTVCSAAEKKRIHLTTPEVSRAAAGDAAIASLVQECQRLMGGVITQADTNILVSMYVADGMPVDMILLGVAHFAAQGKRSARYVERALLGWQRDGIDDGAAAERYLKQLERCKNYEQRAAKLFGIADGKLPKADASLVFEWFEGFGYDESMISEAIAYAGERKTVKYVNGILRRWHGKGYKTVRDVMQESAGTMQNVQVSNPDAKAVLNGGMKRVPVFHAGGELK